MMPGALARIAVPMLSFRPLCGALQFTSLLCGWCALGGPLTTESVLKACEQSVAALQETLLITQQHPGSSPFGEHPSPACTVVRATAGSWGACVCLDEIGIDMVFFGEGACGAELNVLKSRHCFSHPSSHFKAEEFLGPPADQGREDTAPME